MAFGHGEKKPKVKKIRQGKKVTAHGIMLTLLSLVLTFGLFLGLIFLQNYLSDEVVYTSVVVAKQEIPTGTVISRANAETYLTLQQVNVLNTPGEALNSADSLIGKQAVNTLVAGEQIMDKDFESAIPYIENFENPVEMSIDVSSAANADGGKLRSGDLVNITMTYTSEQLSGNNTSNIQSISLSEANTGVTKKTSGSFQNFGSFSKYVLKGVYVKSALNASGAELSASDKTAVATMLIIVVDSSMENDINTMIANGANMRVSKIMNKSAYTSTEVSTEETEILDVPETPEVEGTQEIPSEDILEDTPVEGSSDFLTQGVDISPLTQDLQ